MGLEKSIKSSKEHSKKFRGAKAVDRMCCNHGSCNYCAENRLYRTKKKKEALEYRERMGVEDAPIT